MRSVLDHFVDRPDPRRDTPIADGVGSLLRDIEHLLNATCRDAWGHLPDSSGVCGSVLNYGTRLPFGGSGVRQKAQDLAEAVHVALVRFEPRLDPASIRVTVNEEQLSPHATRLEMEASPRDAATRLRLGVLAEFDSDHQLSRLAWSDRSGRR